MRSIYQDKFEEAIKRLNRPPAKKGIRGQKPLRKQKHECPVNNQAFFAPTYTIEDDEYWQQYWLEQDEEE